MQRAGASRLPRMALQKEGERSFHWQQMEKVLVCAEGVIAVLVQQSAGEYSIEPAPGARQAASAGLRERKLGSQFRSPLQEYNQLGLFLCPDTSCDLGSVYMDLKYAEKYVFSSSAGTCEMLTCCLFCPVKGCSLKAPVAFEFEKCFPRYRQFANTCCQDSKHECSFTH